MKLRQLYISMETAGCQTEVLSGALISSDGEEAVLMYIVHLAAMAPGFHGNQRILLSLNRPGSLFLGGDSSCEVMLPIRIETLPGSCCRLEQFAYTYQAFRAHPQKWHLVTLT